MALLACSDDGGGTADAGTQAAAARGGSSAAGASAPDRDASATAGTSAGGSGARDASAASGSGGRGGNNAGTGASAGAGAGGSAGSGPRDAGGDDARDASSPGPRDGSTADCTVCTDYGAPMKLANIQVPALNALSGIAVSARHDATLWGHNDRNTTEIYALGFDGKPRGRFALSGVTTTDLEDIAVGPCPAGSCVFVADIGDNASARSGIAILRAPEPELPASADGAATPLPALERFAVQYEDGAHNAEGILVDPRGGALYIVTKLPAGMASSVYALPDPLVAGSTNMARKVATLPVPRAGDSPATSTAAHPCGAGFLLRTNFELYEFRIDPAMPFTAAFAVTPVELTGGDEPQSEAVAYLPDGSGFVTSGEMNAAPIFRSQCK